MKHGNQTGALQEIRPDDHAPAESPLGLDGRLAGGADRGEQNTTQETPHPIQPFGGPE